MIGLVVRTTRLTCEEPPHFLFIYVYYFLLMINIHKKNTLNNYRLNHNYTGIYNTIDEHAYFYIVQYL